MDIVQEIEAIRSSADWNRVPFRIGAVWALHQATYEQAEYMLRQGRVGAEEFRRYQFFWTWCAARFSGSAGKRQDKTFDRLGGDALYRRIDRANRLRLRYLARLLAPYRLA